MAVVLPAPRKPPRRRKRVEFIVSSVGTNYREQTKAKIPNNKSQIPNKSQVRITNVLNLVLRLTETMFPRDVLEFRYWNLFGIWCLGLGICTSRKLDPNVAKKNRYDGLPRPSIYNCTGRRRSETSPNVNCQNMRRNRFSPLNRRALEGHRTEILCNYRVDSSENLTQQHQVFENK